MAQVAERLTLFAENVLDGDTDVDERQFGGVLDLAAHLLQFATAGETLHPVLDDEQRQSLAPVFGVGERAGDDDHEVGLNARR